MRYRLRLDRLEHLLSRSRVSQNHWAMRLGLSRGHWSDLRSGRHPYPSAKTRQRLVEVFGVADRDLFEPDQASRDAEFDFRLAIAARFELTSELGQGGMGTVYLANDLRSDAWSRSDAGRRSSGRRRHIPAAAGDRPGVAPAASILPLFDAGELRSPFTSCLGARRFARRDAAFTNPLGNA
jgi:transcriptional regulator with XRE-family HTH domain